jgi:hypothetical protein
MHNCDCPLSTTYCNKLNRTMTPAMVKFCKETPTHRGRLYREPKPEPQYEQQLTEHVFKKSSDIAQDCIRHLLPKIKDVQITGVVGIPRSGMLVAPIVATLLNKALYTISNGEIQVCNYSSSFGGKRMNDYKESNGKLLFLDDTAYTGKEMRNIRVKYPNNIYSVMYLNPSAEKYVDIFGMYLNTPHYLDWHFFNSNFPQSTIFDLDGIFCPDVPIEKAENEILYKEYITTVESIAHRIPRLHPCLSIATARLEKYRDITEDWLKRNNIEYRSLHMYQGTKDDRDSNFYRNVSEYKTSIFLESDARIFVESDDLLAKRIAARSKGKRVICPDSEKVYYVKRV